VCQVFRLGRVPYRDAWALQLCDEQWTVVANRLDEYLTQVGASRPALDPTHPDDLATCRSFLDSL